MSERDIVETLRDQGTRFGYVPGQLPHDEYSAIGQDMHEAAREIVRLRSAPGETEAREALEDAEYALERIELMTRDCYFLPAWWRRVPQRVNKIATTALRNIARPALSQHGEVEG